jgi:hypothetical protein
LALRALRVRLLDDAAQACLAGVVEARQKRTRAYVA